MKRQEKKPEDIQKIIEAGTPLRRAQLYFEHKAAKVYTPDGNVGPGILTKEQETVLKSRFRSAFDVAAFDRFLWIHRTFRLHHAHLQLYWLQYREAIASLIGYCYLETDYDTFSHRLTTLLYALTSKEDKEIFVRILAAQREYLLADIAPTFFGDINSPVEVQAQRQNAENATVSGLIKLYSTRAAAQLKQAKTALTAMRASIKETKYKAPSLMQTLEIIERDLKTNFAPLTRYNREAMTKYIELIMKPDRVGDVEKEKKRVLERLVFPEYEQTDIDEKLYTRLVNIFKIPIKERTE